MIFPNGLLTVPKVFGTVFFCSGCVGAGNFLYCALPQGAKIGKIHTNFKAILKKTFFIIKKWY